MNSILALLLLTTFSALSTLGLENRDQLWQDFKVNFGKKYTTFVEENLRKNIFYSNLDEILLHNEEAKNGIHSFELGINQLSDKTTEEVIKSRNGYLMTNEPRDVSFSYSEEDLKNLPTSMDWRKKGFVTDVKDQGSCGSCWAFSAVASMEGQHMNVTKNLVSLSEQQLVDCSFLKYGNLGCMGGQMDNAFKYAIQEKGMDTEVSYPYTGKWLTSCKTKTGKIAAKFSGFVDLPVGDENALKVAVATVGPISVAIDASQSTFRSYKTGIYFDKSCSSTTLDHGVTVIGYGAENGSDYWLVKNSWNTTWGDKGYIKMARNQENNCGIATKASYPIATKG